MSCQPGRCAGIPAHERLKRDTREWQGLPLVGVQPVPAIEGEDAYSLEMRNVPCGSTIARRVKP